VPTFTINDRLFFLGLAGHANCFKSGYEQMASYANMTERAFKFNSPVITMRSEGGERGVAIIPVNAVVTVVDGDITGTEKFVKVRYQDQTLYMFAKDLRERGEAVLKNFA
jgi:hypothetical protein